MNSKKQVVVIGSGLSAFGAISATLDRNVDLKVIDVGELLPEKVMEKVAKLTKIPSFAKSKFFFDNFLGGKSNQRLIKVLPRKSLFGSHFMYKDERINSKQTLPFSEAFGGFSLVWGAATLMPRKEDLPKLPFDFGELLEYATALTRFIPIPSFDDSLTPYFPNIDAGLNKPSLQLSQSQDLLKNRLGRLISSNRGDLCLIGQARLATFSIGSNACVYCGMCSSGCSSNSIFSAKEEIKKLNDGKALEYLPNRRVTKLVEFNDRVKIISINTESNSVDEIEADYVFVAAGAVNSTKIALESFDLKGEEISFRKTGSFVRGYASFKKLGFDWPDQNTQSNIFMEIHNPEISSHWIHNQISTPNEIVVNSIGYLKKGKFARLTRPLKRWLLSHLIFVMTNLHSEDGPYYQLNLKKVGLDYEFSGDLIIPPRAKMLERKVDRVMNRKLLRIGMLPLPFTKMGLTRGLGYHIGGSLPMGGKSKLATDSLGRFEGSAWISFVDTSVLPSIPATTVGFLAATNAFRIATSILAGD